jgi:hypothetical protein
MGDQSFPSHYTADAEAFFDRVRALLPSFVAVDDEEAEQWQDDGGPLGYIRISALARHLTVLAEQQQWAQIGPVLDDVERTILAGDAYTSELMVIGLLEDLQNDLLRTEGRVRLIDVRDRLGPASQAGWDDLMGFWHGPASEARTLLPPGSLPDEP